VSHDRHFLDTVCTHVADIDFGKLQIFTGNYSFWYQASQLASKQRADKNKKMEDKAAELKDFIARFSANASKSKQATSRKKALDKLDFAEIKPSNRKYPAILWKPEREAGDIILEVKNLTAYDTDGNCLFKDLTFEVAKNDKIAVIADNHLAVSALFNIVSGLQNPDAGEYKWGQTIKHAYLPADNTEFFIKPETLMDWLRQFAPDSIEVDEQFIRSYLGKMLFSGDDVHKTSNVLSGGEKMRCMIARMMLQNPNFIILDEPTNHLDLESITAFNESLKDFNGTALFSSYDHEFTNSSSNRIIELAPSIFYDKLIKFDEYLNWKKSLAAG
jgi:ATPase subunit of ABC transporter with duplicated ATPase domains